MSQGWLPGTMRSWCAHNGVISLRSDLLNDLQGVDHGFLSRKGGESSPPFDSLNFSYSVGDLEKNVRSNFTRLSGAIQLPIAMMEQEHGTTIAEVQAPPQKPIVADVLATDSPKLALFVRYADCQPIILFDPIQKALAVVHAGWRGSVQNILAKTVSFLKHRYFSHPSDLFAVVGPSLSVDHAHFDRSKLELPSSFYAYQRASGGVDFWAISRDQLLAAGLLYHHIDILALCSYQTVDHCFSFRRERTTGRNGGWASIKAS